MLSILESEVLFGCFILIHSCGAIFVVVGAAKEKHTHTAADDSDDCIAVAIAVAVAVAIAIAIAVAAAAVGGRISSDGVPSYAPVHRHRHRRDGERAYVSYHHHVFLQQA